MRQSACWAVFFGWKKFGSAQLYDWNEFAISLMVIILRITRSIQCSHFHASSSSFSFSILWYFSLLQNDHRNKQLTVRISSWMSWEYTCIVFSFSTNVQSTHTHPSHPFFQPFCHQMWEKKWDRMSDTAFPDGKIVASKMLCQKCCTEHAVDSESILPDDFIQ